MTEFTLKQLEVLSAVAETGSFTAAAEKLYLSQSTVSGHVAALEESLGVPLFLRGSRKKATLTSEGFEVLRQAQRILSLCSELSASVQSAHAEELVIAASSVPADHLIPSYMARFLGRNPDCKFVVRQGDSAAAHEMLRRHESQLALVGKVLDEVHFAYRAVASDRLWAVCPNTPEFQHLQENGVLGKELLHYPLIFREEGSGTQRWTDEYLRRSGAESFAHIVARMESTGAILDMVERGLGISIISALAAKKHAENGSVLAFELDDPPVMREIYLAWEKGADLTESAEAFKAMLLD